MMRTLLLVILLVLAGCGQPRISGPSLIAFHATWCQPCQRDKPLLARVSQEYPVTDVDFDGQHAIAAQYHVSVLPTYIVLSGREGGHADDGPPRGSSDPSLIGPVISRPRTARAASLIHRGWINEAERK